MLPTKKTPVVTDPTQFTLCLYGPGGIGKSTWASHAEGALFIASEPGLNALEVFQVKVETLKEMGRVYDEIKNGDHGYKTIIVDTVDRVFQMCIDAVCEELGIVYPRGKMGMTAWGMINSRFRNWTIQMCNLPYGVLFISHSATKERDTRTGPEMYTQLGLPDSSRKSFGEAMDIVLLAEYVSKKDNDGKVVEERVLRARGTGAYYAKDRTGRLPESLPFKYEAFTKAFNAVINPKGKSK